MKLANMAALILMAAVAALPAPASAALRDPQVALSGGGTNLQNQINILNGPGINVNDDQEDFMRWGRNKTGAGTFTLSFAFNGDLGVNAIGVYNAVTDDGQAVSASDRFEIFPAGTPQNWYALAQFNLDNTLVVTLFDSNDNIQAGYPKPYNGVHVNDFGFYIEKDANDSNRGYGQDLLNSNDEARVLVLPGTGVSNGGWFMCFEDGVPSVPPAQALGIVDTELQDFDEAILFIEAVRPVPVNKTTWAALKSRFR